VDVSWQAGSQQTIRFSHNLGPDKVVNLALSRDGGKSWSPIAAMKTVSATNEKFSWEITGPPTAEALIRATAEASGVSDVSDFNFAITPRVRVTAPNNPIIWGAGSTRTIAWNHNLPAGETVNIDFSTNGGAT
jgi:hypothetical protein